MGDTETVGRWEPDGLSLDPRQVAIGQPLAVSPGWDVLSGFARDLTRFAPAVTETGVREVFRGFPAFSPDGRFIVGPVPALRGFVMAAACNAHGVSGSAGLAEHVLESLQPKPSSYVRMSTDDLHPVSPAHRGCRRLGVAGCGQGRTVRPGRWRRHRAVLAS